MTVDTHCCTSGPMISSTHVDDNEPILSYLESSLHKALAYCQYFFSIYFLCNLTYLSLPFPLPYLRKASCWPPFDSGYFLFSKLQRSDAFLKSCVFAVCIPSPCKGRNFRFCSSAVGFFCLFCFVFYVLSTYCTPC